MGGGAHYLNLDKATLDTHIAVLEVSWKESMSPNQYPLVLFNDSKYLTLGIHFLLCGYFAIDDGLHYHDPSLPTIQGIHVCLPFTAEVSSFVQICQS